MKRAPATTTRRWRSALLALVCALALAAVTGSSAPGDRAARGEDAAPPRAAEPTPARSGRAGPAGSGDEAEALLAALDPVLLVRPRTERIALDPFNEPPPPAPPPAAPPAPPVRVVAPAPVAAPPAPPQAPPLPFRYVGRLADANGVVRIFLARGETGLAVNVGDTIEGQYRVAELGPREIVFVYLPLDMRQPLVIE